MIRDATPADVPEIARTTDAEQVDRWVRRDFPEAETLAYALGNPMNVCLAQGEGGAIFVWRGPGIYEAHCFYEQRGREVIELTRRILAKMRGEYGARMFWAAIPEDSRKVKMFVRLLGWKSVGRETFPHGLCEIFVGE